MDDAGVSQHLKRLLDYHPDLIIDVNEEVQHLYEDLILFRGFSHEFIGNRNSDREFVKRIRDLVYRAEDTVDKYISLALTHNFKSQFTKAIHSCNYYLQIVRKSKREIESIRAEFKNVYEKMGLQDGGATSSNNKMAPIVGEEEHSLSLKGFQDEAEKVITLLTSDLKERDIISIVGMPGLGKTTLAMNIFHHHKIKEEFKDSRAWVSVSQWYKYNRKEVFLSILHHFIQPTIDMYEMSDEKLSNVLYRLLEETRYLIVLDDVWTLEAWDQLENVFPRNNKRSRILITSRTWNLAKHANPMRDPHRLCLLSVEESWSLLLNKSLSSDTCFEEKTMKLVKSIVDHCKGLPLALVVIGDILLSASSSQWEKVANSVSEHLFSDPKERINTSIARSFNHLPHDMKLCFLYIGMLQKDYHISKSELVRLWIAEGFIQHCNEMSSEDIAEEYLEDLVNRNLVIVTKRGLNGTVKTCQVHDIVSEFCKRQAKDENLFLQIKQGTSSSFNQEARLVCIDTSILDFVSSKSSSPSHIRSLLSFNRMIHWCDGDEYVSLIARALELVRVFRVKRLYFSTFPVDLSHLIHLRYLFLWGHFEIIPAAISKLWNMQTLVIETSTSIPTLVIEADIGKMARLSHIITNVPASFPVHFDRNSSIHGCLQTLSKLAPESCREDVLARAPMLKKLCIRGRLCGLLEGEVKGGFDYICNLTYLKKLKLQNSSDGKVGGLPQVCAFPPNIKKLTLSDTQLDWKHMSTVGKLQNLEILKLKRKAFMGELWQTEMGGFPNLEILYIDRTNLVYWQTSARHLPRLRCLYIWCCFGLEAVPFCLAHVSSLQKINLESPNKPLVLSARKIQQHKQSMQENSRHKDIGFTLSIYHYYSYDDE